MSYLEKSTRYVGYDSRLDGRYRYFRPPEVMSSPWAPATWATSTACSTPTPSCVPQLQDWCRERHPKARADSDFVYRSTIRAKALDAVRGILPAASLSNLGIYGTGQAYEALRHAHAGVGPARGPGLRRAGADRAAQGHPLVPQPGRPARPGRRLGRVPPALPGGDWPTAAAEVLPGATPSPSPRSTLVDFDPEGEDKLLAALLYPHTDLPDAVVLDHVRKLSTDERVGLVRAAAASGAAAATGRAGPSSAPTTASTSAPTTAPSGTSSATASSPSSGRR